MLRRYSLNRGFTLIEISIVLVIIGLLAGGVLIGRDLIRAAEIRAQMRQIDSYKLAIRTFSLKYSCIPGDCAQAVALGLGTDVFVDNGDGNGLIGPFQTNSSFGYWYAETFRVWRHLAAAGLISGNYPFGGQLPGVTTPALAMSGTGHTGRDPQYTNPRGGFHLAGNIFDEFAVEKVFNNGFVLLSDFAIASSWFDRFIGVYHPQIVYNLDIKMDDGLPKTGRMRGISQGSFVNDSFLRVGPYYLYSETAGPTGVNSCVKTGAGSEPDTYNLTAGNVPSAMCAPLIDAGF